MVLYPLDAPEQSAAGAIEAWQAVSERQLAPASRFLLIQQPHHARISGEVALAMTASGVPVLTSDVVRAIELHDQGWAKADKERVASKQRPASFLHAAPGDFLTAWTESIRTATAICPISGFIVSSHFRQLAEFGLKVYAGEAEITTFLQEFIAREQVNEERLLAADGRNPLEAERLVRILQFCDLLSLYLCSGATRPAVFPQAVFDNSDARIAIRQNGDHGFVLTPSPFSETVRLRTQASGYPEDQADRILEWMLS